MVLETFMSERGLVARQPREYFSDSCFTGIGKESVKRDCVMDRKYESEVQ